MAKLILGSLKYATFCSLQVFSSLNYSTSRVDLKVLCRKESLNLFILLINPVEFYSLCLNPKGVLLQELILLFLLNNC